MKQLRKLAARGILVPVALVALIGVSSLPASAAALPSHTSVTAKTAVAHPESINW